MCLAVIAIKAHPQYPFICLANRDEFHERPTAALQEWPMATGAMWSGKDLQAGGTWLGIGSNAEFALLTNVRNATLNMPSTAPSRGNLVTNAIEQGLGPQQDHAMSYAGFNLIHGNLKSLALFCTSNQGLKLNNGLPYTIALQKGIYSLSNGHLDASWPKSKRLKNSLQSEIKTSTESEYCLEKFEQKLFELLAHKELADDAELPKTGIPYEWEKMLSAVKIVSPMYGTRTSAVILLDMQLTAHFAEITFNADGKQIGRQRYEIPLSPIL